MEEKKMQYLFGMHPVLEAVKAGKKFDKVLLKQGLEGPQFRELMELLKVNEIPFQFVPGERLNRAVRGSHQGVLAYISQIEYVEIEQLVNNALGVSENPLLVILDGVSDVRNLGAIARSLECAGGQGVIVPAKGGAAINADAVKASAGALMRIDTCKVSNLRVAAYYLQQSGFKLIAAKGSEYHLGRCERLRLCVDKGVCYVLRPCSRRRSAGYHKLRTVNVENDLCDFVVGFHHRIFRHVVEVLFVALMPHRFNS